MPISLGSVRRASSNAACSWQDGETPGANFIATWTFEVVEDGKTRVTGRLLFPSAAMRDHVVREFGAIEGGKQTLERLGEQVAAMQAKGRAA